MSVAFLTTEPFKMLIASLKSTSGGPVLSHQSIIISILIFHAKQCELHLKNWNNHNLNFNVDNLGILESLLWNPPEEKLFFSVEFLFLSFSWWPHSWVLSSNSFFGAAYQFKSSQWPSKLKEFWILGS